MKSRTSFPPPPSPFPIVICLQSSAFPTHTHILFSLSVSLSVILPGKFIIHTLWHVFHCVVEYGYHLFDVKWQCFEWNLFFILQMGWVLHATHAATNATWRDEKNATTWSVHPKFKSGNCPILGRSLTLHQLLSLPSHPQSKQTSKITPPPATYWSQK